MLTISGLSELGFTARPEGHVALQPVENSAGQYRVVLLTGWLLTVHVQLLHLPVINVQNVETCAFD